MKVQDTKCPKYFRCRKNFLFRSNKKEQNSSENPKGQNKDVKKEEMQ